MGWDGSPKRSEFKEAMGRGEKLGLNSDEAAFYDALGTNDSAVRECIEILRAALATEPGSGRHLIASIRGRFARAGYVDLEVPTPGRDRVLRDAELARRAQHAAALDAAQLADADREGLARDELDRRRADR